MAKLKTIDQKDIPNISRLAKSVGKELLEAFLASDAKATEVIPEKDEKAISLRWSINRAIIASNAKAVVGSRGGRIYLQRTK